MQTQPCHSEPVRTLAWESVPFQWENGLPRPRWGLAMTAAGILQHALRFYPEVYFSISTI